MCIISMGNGWHAVMYFMANLFSSLGSLWDMMDGRATGCGMPIIMEGKGSQRCLALHDGPVLLAWTVTRT